MFIFILLMLFFKYNWFYVHNNNNYLITYKYKPTIILNYLLPDNHCCPFQLRSNWVHCKCEVWITLREMRKANECVLSFDILLRVAQTHLHHIRSPTTESVHELIPTTPIRCVNAYGVVYRYYYKCELRVACVCLYAWGYWTKWLVCAKGNVRNAHNPQNMLRGSSDQYICLLVRGNATPQGEYDWFVFKWTLQVKPTS